jgi:hypothetical protein
VLSGRDVNDTHGTWIARSTTSEDLVVINGGTGERARRKCGSAIESQRPLSPQLDPSAQQRPTSPPPPPDTVVHMAPGYIRDRRALQRKERGSVGQSCVSSISSAAAQ